MCSYWTQLPGGPASTSWRRRPSARQQGAQGAVGTCPQLSKQFQCVCGPRAPPPLPGPQGGQLPVPHDWWATYSDGLPVTLQTHAPQKIRKSTDVGGPHEEEVHIPGKAQSRSKRQLEPGQSDAFSHQKPYLYPQGRRASRPGSWPRGGPSRGGRELGRLVGRRARNSRDVSWGGRGVLAAVGGRHC